MRHKHTRFQKIAIAWLKFFTVACFADSVLVIKYRFWGLAGFYAAFLLPFGHLAILALCLMAYSLYWILSDRQSSDPGSQYVKTKVMQNPICCPVLLTLVIWGLNFILMHACWEFA